MPTSPSSVQKLQTALHAKAKAEPSFRFYLRYDKVYRADILAHAHACCKANKGAAGVDEQEFADVEEIRVFYDVAENTVEILAIVPKAEAQTWLEQFGDAE